MPVGKRVQPGLTVLPDAAMDRASAMVERPVIERATDRVRPA